MDILLLSHVNPGFMTRKNHQILNIQYPNVQSHLYLIILGPNTPKTVVICIYMWLLGWSRTSPRMEPRNHRHCHLSSHRSWLVVLTHRKQDAAHEPECSHVWLWYRCRNTWICSHAEHCSAIVYLNSLVHNSPVTSPQCGVESVECGVWSGKCRAWSVK